MIWSFALLWLVCQGMTNSNSPGSVLSCLRKPLGEKWKKFQTKKDQTKKTPQNKKQPKTPTN